MDKDCDVIDYFCSTCRYVVAEKNEFCPECGVNHVEGGV